MSQTTNRNNVATSTPTNTTTTTNNNTNIEHTGIKFTLLGNVDSGKSTLVGTLISGIPDSGSTARQTIVLHPHEIITHKTSTITHHYYGYDKDAVPIQFKTVSKNFESSLHALHSTASTGGGGGGGGGASKDNTKQKKEKNTTDNSAGNAGGNPELTFAKQHTAFNNVQRNKICQYLAQHSVRTVTLIDLCGHEFYLKTTTHGVIASKPDAALIVISPHTGLSKITIEHISLCVALKLRFAIVITKVDRVNNAAMLKSLWKELQAFLSEHCKRQPVLVKSVNDVTTVVTGGVVNSAQQQQQINPDVMVPIFYISNTTLQGFDLLHNYIARLKRSTWINNAAPQQQQPALTPQHTPTNNNNNINNNDKFDKLATAATTTDDVCLVDVPLSQQALTDSQNTTASTPSTHQSYTAPLSLTNNNNNNTTNNNNTNNINFNVVTTHEYALNPLLQQMISADMRIDERWYKQSSGVIVSGVMNYGEFAAGGKALLGPFNFSQFTTDPSAKSRHEQYNLHPLTFGEHNNNDNNNKNDNNNNARQKTTNVPEITNVVEFLPVTIVSIQQYRQSVSSAAVGDGVGLLLKYDKTTHEKIQKANKYKSRIHITKELTKDMVIRGMVLLSLDFAAVTKLLPTLLTPQYNPAMPPNIPAKQLQPLLKNLYYIPYPQLVSQFIDLDVTVLNQQHVVIKPGYQCVLHCGSIQLPIVCSKVLYKIFAHDAEDGEDDGVVINSNVNQQLVPTTRRYQQELLYEEQNNGQQLQENNSNVELTLRGPHRGVVRFKFCTTHFVYINQHEQVLLRGSSTLGVGKVKATHFVLPQE